MGDEELVDNIQNAARCENLERAEQVGTEAIMERVAELCDMGGRLRTAGEQLEETTKKTGLDKK
jgi:hypothetical protein